MGAPNSFKCPHHFQLIRLCPDHHSSVKLADNSASSNTFTDEELQHLQHKNHERFIIPVCLYNHCSWSVPSKLNLPCVCPENATSGLHPSVCPETGRLRIAWLSQGGQVRVLSCSFSKSESACNLPMVRTFTFSLSLIYRVHIQS